MRLAISAPCWPGSCAEEPVGDLRQHRHRSPRCPGTRTDPRAGQLDPLVGSGGPDGGGLLPRHPDRSAGVRPVRQTGRRRLRDPTAGTPGRSGTGPARRRACHRGRPFHRRLRSPPPSPSNEATWSASPWPEPRTAPGAFPVFIRTVRSCRRPPTRRRSRASALRRAEHRPGPAGTAFVSRQARADVSNRSAIRRRGRSSPAVRCPRLPSVRRSGCARPGRCVR